MPACELLIKIARLAGDERGDPMVRRNAFDSSLDSSKAIRIYSPRARRQRHPSSRTPRRCGLTFSAPDVEDKPAARAKGPVDKRRARFMDHTSWSETAKGNPSIEIVWRGVAYRIVLFEYKKSPMVGFLLINEDTDEQTFSQLRYKTYGEARAGAWEAVCAL